MIKKGWLVFWIVVILVIIFFNLNYLGFSVLNTTSNVSVAGSNSFPVIGTINNSLFVCEGNILYYEFNATDADGNYLTGSINPENPFFLFWISQPAVYVTTFGIVSSTLDKDDFGGINVGSRLYKETITITDNYNSTCCSDTEKTNITIIEKNNPPEIEDVGVKTIWTKEDNSSFYEVIDANDIEYNHGYGNLTFNVSIINSSGNSVNLFNISSPQGIINFTATNQTAIGVYDVTVCVNDSGLTSPHANIYSYCNQTGASLSDCDNFSVTVTNENRAPNITAYFPYNTSFSVIGTDTTYFNSTARDPDGTIPDAYWYVDGVLNEYDSGNSINYFNYAFGCDVYGNHNVSVVVTDGLLNDSLTWLINVQAVSCFVSPPSGGGGGGGGGGGSPDNFEVSPDFITTSVFKGEGKSYDIKIKNTGSTNLNLYFNTENLTDMALLKEDNFSLKAGEEKIVRVYLYALEGKKAGVYFGRINIYSGSMSKYISVVLEIKDKQALFDIKVRIPPNYKSVYPDQDLKTYVDMLNVGLYGTAVDVELYLYITNFDKLIFYETTKEVIAVETNLTVERMLHVPISTPVGTYLVLGEVRYNNLTITTYDTFAVVEKKYLRVSLVLIIAIVIALILFILFLLWKRRKKKEEERYR